MRNIKCYFKSALFYFSIGSAIGIFNSTVVITTLLAERSEFHYSSVFIGEFTGGYSFALLLPVMLYIFRKYPVSKNSYIKPLFIYLCAYIPVGLFHILFMYYSREIINQIAGWGSYDYGNIYFRIPMEYIKLSTGMIAACLISNLSRSNKEKDAEKLRRASLEEQLTQARLDILKNQLNPHFLFNTLNMISSAMYENVDAADKMISNLSIILRAALQSSDDNTYTLKDEIEMISIYMDIMKARFNDKLNISYSIAPQSMDCSVPRYILQPLIENSIKYGMETPGSVFIELTAVRQNDVVVISVKDNGPGISDNSNNILTKGVGLSNTIERLNNFYNRKAKFTWRNLENGFLVQIELPYKKV